MDIGTWLRGLGLQRYEQAFRENEIDLRVLPKLTANDLKELGVAAIGHRRLLIDAIAALTAQGARAAADAAPATPVRQVVAQAERRQLTVMFCDLVGSTALSVRLDPEDLREVIGAYHRCVSDTIARFAGFVARYMGDGALIYFGYPEAHEDDADRAVRAGLATIDAVGRLAGHARLSVRLGIASGLVVVGDLIGEGDPRDHDVVGTAPNLAARLQALAAPNTLVIAESTRRQIGALFELEELGPQALAGFATKNSSYCCGAGNSRKPARVRWCWSWGSRGSVSRVWARSSSSASSPRPTRGYAISVRPTIRTRRFIRSSSSSNALPGLHGMTRLGKSSVSCGNCSSPAHATITKFRWLPSSFHCRVPPPT
jgi:class 3 adenylate cyclase